MAWNIEEGVGNYFGFNSKTYEITDDKAQSNISQFYSEIMTFCKACNLTPPTMQAIAGIAGNIMRECTFNPGLREDGGTGLGLIQWTPGSLLKDWCTKVFGNENYWNRSVTIRVKKTDYTSGDITIFSQVLLVLCEGFKLNGLTFELKKENGTYKSIGLTHRSGYFYSGYGYNYTWPEFCQLTDIETATKAYVYERERAGVIAMDDRLGFAKSSYKIMQKGGGFVPRLDNDEVLYNKPYWVATSKGGKNKCVARANFNSWPGSASTEDRQKITSSGSVLANCTGYAWGRALELMGGESPDLSTSNAGEWYPQNKAAHSADSTKGYEYGSVPKPGAIMCWENPGQAGHVAVVEKVDGDKVIVSESGYNGGFNYKNYYWVSNAFKYDEVRWGTYKLQGFIYIPCLCAPIGSGTLYFPKPRIIQTFGDSVVVSILALGKDRYSKVEYSLVKAAKEDESEPPETPDTEEEGTDSVKMFYVKNLKNCFQKIKNVYTFSINQLEPLTKYRFFVKVTDKDGTSTYTSKEMTFTTDQSYPEPVSNITLESISKEKHTYCPFRVTFTAPESWGYWYEQTKKRGYTAYLIVNGKPVKEWELNTFDRNFTFTPNLYYPSIKAGDTIQIKISSWVRDSDNKKVYNKYSSDTSPAVQLLENNFEAYLMNPTIKKD